MEILTLLLVFIILFVLISFKNDLGARTGNLEQEIKKLRQKLEDLSTITPPPIKTPTKKEWKSGFKEEEVPEIKETVEDVPAWQQVQKESEALQSIETFTPAPIPEQPKPIYDPSPSFFERHPDLERFIGENLAGKIGIGILVLAIGYFVKYAIDNDWIGVIGRVAIGVVCGGILIGLAHKMRNSYKAFSSVLVGGGLAVLYFTIALGYHQFHLFSQPVAFVIMLVITSFAVLLSILYDRQEVAIIALVGGFATPFIVTDGSGNYKSLFTYLIILNTGLLVIAYRKAWRLLNVLAFIFTVILSGAWLLLLPDKEPAATYVNALIFFTVFYLLFYSINIAHNIKENKKFIASDFGILLANTALYFSAGMYCLNSMQADNWFGLFSAAMAIFNLAISYYLFKRRAADINILYLLIGITLTFVSLTAPLQLNGSYITLFWASECVLLYWLYQKSKIPIVRIASLIVWGAMLLSLFMDWNNVYANSIGLRIVFNRGFITSVYAAVASYILFFLMRREASSHLPPTLTAKVKLVAVVLLYIGDLLEILHQFQAYYPQDPFDNVSLHIYTSLFVIITISVDERYSSNPLPSLIKLLMLAATFLIFIATTQYSYTIQENALMHERNNGLYIFSLLLSAIATALVLYKMIQVIRRSSLINDSLNGLTWAVCIMVIIYVSIEASLLSNSLFYSKTLSIEETQRVFIKAVLPILWGVSSFVFMWLGMRHKYPPLRIVSLSLFTLTLAKLFMYDIRNIPVAGKIAAFFCLGVILLVVSFMYQRLKKIIIEDEKKASA